MVVGWRRYLTFSGQNHRGLEAFGSSIHRVAFPSGRAHCRLAIDAVYPEVDVRSMDAFGMHPSTVKLPGHLLHLNPWVSWVCAPHRRGLAALGVGGGAPWRVEVHGAWRLLCWGGVP